MKERKRELDFLRGVAILLVMLRHQPFHGLFFRIGWTGVDLFFVLSGFLVSGLLIQEFQQTGHIRPGRFLIRRGFKIYPLYYLFYFPYFLLEPFRTEGINHWYVAADLLFFQNYVLGFGYAISSNWSVIIEEHFYLILIATLAWFDARNSLKRLFLDKSPYPRFVIFIVMLLVTCLALRLYTNYLFPADEDRNYTMSHLRMDSLLIGVLIAWFYYCRFSALSTFYQKYKRAFIPLIFLFLGWVWVVLHIRKHFLSMTFGFSAVYLGYALILVFALCEPKVNQILNSIFSKIGVDLLAKIGAWSYPIYLVHEWVNQLFRLHLPIGIWFNTKVMLFLETTFISVLFGYLSHRYLERPVLAMRDKYFP